MSGWSQRSHASTVPSGDNAGDAAQSPSATSVTGSTGSGDPEGPPSATAAISLTGSAPSWTSRSQMIQRRPSTSAPTGVSTPAAWRHPRGVGGGAVTGLAEPSTPPPPRAPPRTPPPATMPPVRASVQKSCSPSAHQEPPPYSLTPLRADMSDGPSMTDAGAGSSPSGTVERHTTMRPCRSGRCSLQRRIVDPSAARARPTDETRTAPPAASSGDNGDGHDPKGRSSGPPVPS